MLKVQLRKAYLFKRKQEIQKRGSLLYSKIQEQFCNILQREFNNKITFIGSYIFSPGKQIIPPQLPGYSHAFPYFQPKRPLQIAPIMLFKEYTEPKEWSNKVYGIKVPPKSLPTVLPQIIIVPLLCFNPKTKHRVGYGGGYYDQYIKNSKQLNKKIVFVGIGYQILKQQSMFADSFDQRLDYIITQKAIY